VRPASRIRALHDYRPTRRDHAIRESSLFPAIMTSRRLAPIVHVTPHMKVVLPTDGDRISPLLDAARCFVLVGPSPDGALIRKQALIADADPITKAKRIVGLGGEVLICGAISWPLEAMLSSAGMRVIPNTCGPLEEVIAAFFAGGLTEQAFLMPGCPGRRHRHRHRHGRRWRSGW
jgi:predicted Fe-Mo cluster-binding NifX family protein